MDQPTPSGTVESHNENAPASAVGDPTDAAAIGNEQKVDAENANGSPKEDEAELSAEELLQEAAAEQAKPSELINGQSPDQHRAKNAERFANEKNDALNRVYGILSKEEWDTPEDRQKLLEKAIKSERPDFANHLRKEVGKLESGKFEQEGSPKEEGEELSNEAKIRNELDRREDSRNADQLFLKICSDAGIGKKTANAIETRKKLVELRNLILANQKTPRYTEALQDAAGRLGILSNKTIEEARKAGMRLGRGALPPAGDQPQTPSKNTFTEEELSQMSEVDYSKAMARIDKGEAKIVIPTH